MDGFKIFSNENELDPPHLQLIQQARKASESSYSPYSNYMVGAALLLENDAIFAGSNQENAAYPAGLCAERVALFHTASLYPEKAIKSIATVAKRHGDSHFRPVSPCGICRQVILEYELKQKSPIQVILQIPNGHWVVTENSKVLLPFCFDKESL